MKALWIARKTVLELLREPVLLLTMLFMPAGMMLIFSLAYSPQIANQTLTLALSDTSGQAGGILQHLQEARLSNGKPVFDIITLPPAQQLKDDLITGKIAMSVEFELLSPQQLAVRFTGDGTSTKYIRASNAFFAALTPTDKRQLSLPAQIDLKEYSPSTRTAASYFELLAPGMMIFAVLLIIPQTAILLGREIRKGNLKRLQLSGVSNPTLIAGLSLALGLLAIIQILLMFATALALGFQNQGSVFLAIFVSLILAVSGIGLGVMAAGFCKDDSVAFNFGSGFTMIQVFLSGAFFPMPSLTAFTLFNHEIGLFDFLPASHAMLALQQILISGASWADITFRLSMTILLSLLYLILGMWVFDRRYPVH